MTEAATATAVLGKERWTKPQPGSWKCNVDAALFEGEKKIGFGGIVRDANGNFVAAVQGARRCFPYPLFAEAIGLRDVLSWLKDAAFHSIVIETDSQMLANAVNSEDNFCSSLGIIVDDCKALCKAIDQCRVVFIRRSANYVAHSLAKASNYVSGRRVFDVCPSFILDVLAEDLNE